MKVVASFIQLYQNVRVSRLLDWDAMLNHCPFRTYSTGRFAGFCLLVCFVDLPVCVAAAVDVYILTGQSNSLGTTAFEGDFEAEYGPGIQTADATVQFLWSNVTSGNVSYPPSLYGDAGGQVTSLQMQQGGDSNPAFWGPEFGLARSLFANNGPEDVLIIKASRGGGGNTFWDKGAFDSNAGSGHMWGHLRDTVDVALNNLAVQGDTFTVKGLLYLQGESNNSTEAAMAAVRLEDLAINLRSHIETSHAGTTADMHTVIGEIAASTGNSNRQITTQQHQLLAETNADFSFVTTNDLPLKQDGIHFGRDAKLAIGARFGISILDQIQAPNGVPGDVNQDGILTGDGTGLPENDDIAAFVDGWRADTSLLSSLNKVRSGDLDLSGQTDLADAFQMHEALAAAGSAFPFHLLVPEPETGAQAVLAFGFLLWGFRRIRQTCQATRPTRCEPIEVVV